MIKSFLLLWKNIFNYTGRCGRKDYWLGLIANVIFMYIAAIPYALITAFLAIPLPVMITLFLIIIHLPALSAYVRRANDINMKLGDMLLVGLAVPLIGAIIVGMIGSLANDGKKYPFAWLLRMILIGMGIELVLSNVLKSRIVYDKAAIVLLFVMTLFVLILAGVDICMEVTKTY